MKILITGARGQLGRDCQAILGAAHDLVATDLPELDASDAAQVRDIAAAMRPDVILNCAAFTRVDDCEKQRDLAFRANEEVPRLLAAAARVLGAHLVHISTDYVFDGERPIPQPYRESDVTRPLSVYGMSKLAGENVVRASGARFAILRTAWLYGRHGGNFPKTMLRLALAQPAQERKVIAEQYGSPTWSWEGHTTWFGFASAFISAMGVPHKLAPCGVADFPLPARRPVNSILENSRLKAAKLNVMKPWDADLAEFVARYRDELLEEVRAALSRPQTQGKAT
ncbi:MAG: NAD(P)-dependent oxidoreductase [Kiritimatiellaeota bacterium]|nr:NAD(P)-dependent oxidoreductase [Kiritimatiellota bacterium]